MSESPTLMFMSANEKKQDHIDEEDLKRAESGTGEKAPLKANEEDAHIAETELDNPSEEAKESAKKNDPTAGKSPSH